MRLDNTRVTLVVLAVACIAPAGYLLLGPNALLLTVLAIAAVVVAVAYPGLLLAAYLLLPFYKEVVQPYSPLDITPMIAILCACQVAVLATEGRLFSLPRGLVVLWTLLAAIVLAGVLYAPDQEIGAFRAVSFISLVLVPLLPAAARVASRERYLRQFTYAFLVMGCLVVVIGLFVPPEGERVTVLGINTIQTARAALLVPLIAAALAPEIPQRWARLALTAMALGAILVALASGSRGPVVAILIIGAIEFGRYLARPHGARSPRIAFAVVVTIAALLIVVSGAIELPDVATARFGRLADFVSETFMGAEGMSPSDTSAAVRVQLFVGAVEMIEASPIWGAGTAAFETVGRDVLWPSAADQYPHNAVLQLGSEHGIVGVAVFLGLIVLAWTRPIPNGSYGHVIRVLFLFFLINAMFSGNIYEDRMLWGLLVLLAMIGVPKADGAQQPREDAEVVDDRQTLASAQGPVARQAFGRRGSDLAPADPTAPQRAPGPFSTPFEWPRRH